MRGRPKYVLTSLGTYLLHVDGTTRYIDIARYIGRYLCTEESCVNFRNSPPFNNTSSFV